jgi:hypothetical protein
MTMALLRTSRALGDEHDDGDADGIQSQFASS